MAPEQRNRTITLRNSIDTAKRKKSDSRLAPNYVGNADVLA
jgi:hypothetical protein